VWHAGTKFDVIILDIDAKDVSTGLSCPPAAFLNSDWLSCVSKTLRETGVYIVNLVCRNTSLRQQVMTTHSQHFSTLVSTRLADAVNEVLIGTQQVAALSDVDLKTRTDQLRCALNKSGLVAADQVDVICERLRDLQLVTQASDP
jgi:spermidine synthase